MSANSSDIEANYPSCRILFLFGEKAYVCEIIRKCICEIPPSDPHREQYALKSRSHLGFN